MKTFVIVLVLPALLVMGCSNGLQSSTTPPPPVKPPQPAAIQAGPGLWPTGMPAPPSPAIPPGSAPAVATAPSQGAGTVGVPPATIPSTTTVASSQVVAWITYESINAIRDLTFAPDGTLWAATFGGLIHWDLNTQAGARPPYARYPIQARALALAPDGSLWLALEGAVCHFDGASCQVYSEADGLLGNDVYTISVTPDGTVWVGTGQGVSRFDGDSWQSYPSPVATRDLAVTANGEVWAATAGGVGRYLPGKDAWITYTEEDGLPGLNAQVIAAGPPQGRTRQGRSKAGDEVWAYLVWEGVYRFDGAGWQEVEGAGGEISDIAFAADGTPWVATAGGLHYPGGTLSYHDGDQWRDIACDQKLHSFRSIALGPGGIIAVRTQLGLGLYEGGEWRLLRDGPTSEEVTSVAVTPDGTAWFAFGDHSVSTPGRGLSRFDGQAWDYHLDDAEVNVLAVGPDGTLWAGVGCSVQRFDGVAWEVVGHCENLPAGNVLDIDFAPDGTVWVATGFGLARFDGVSWTVYESLVHALAVAPDGTIWMNGWEGTQNSSYVAHSDGQTWTVLKSSDSYPGGFSVGAVTADGLLWGTTPEGQLASFDGHSWIDGESWMFYDPLGSRSVDNIAVLTVAPDGALWLASGGSVIRFDRENGSEETWTIYTQDDGLPESYYQAMAFGPDGEIWFGATRFEPARTEAGAAKPKAAPRIVETALPTATAKSPEPPAPYCRPSEAFVDISVPTMKWPVGQVLTVTVTLANGDGSSVQLGQIQYSLNVEPDMLVLSDPEPVQHPASIDPGDCDQAHFVLQAIAPGTLVLTASASYEMHALDYSSASWSGCQSHPLEITISSPEPKDCSLANAFPPQEAELVWPTLHQVQPDHPTPGQQVEIRGTGGFLYWNNECGEFRDESARDFQLLFDGEPVAPITCYAHTCLANLIIAADAEPGIHTISVEGGSSIDIQIARAAWL